jgi:hypothetical protein
MNKRIGEGAFMKSLYAALLSVEIFLCGCSQLVVSGGGNDFPNSHTTVSALGKMIADNLANGDHWSDSVALPQASTPLASAQAISIPNASTQGLSKSFKSLSTITMRLDYSDTAHGTVSLFSFVESDSVLKSDTLIILYDETFRDSIKNNEHLKSVKGSTLFKRSNIISSYSYTDADGDGILNNRNGKPNRVIVLTSETFPLGSMTQSEIEIDGGKDGNLDTKEDMRIITYKTLTLDKKGDTLAWTQYESRDNDSVILDASDPDSCLVRIRTLETALIGQRTVSEAVFVIFPLSSGKNFPVYYQSSKSLGGLVRIKQVVRNPKPDSLLTAGDTAVVYRILESPDDSTAVDTLCLRIATHGVISDSSRNDLIGFYHHRAKHIGIERDIVFSLTCDEPIKASDKPQSGSFSLRISYNDKHWVALAGSFTPIKITADFTDSQGNKRTLTWNRNGDSVQ